MAENCKNCDEIISASFCGNCGQKKFKRIDKKYIWDEIQYTILHTNKGFLYSVKNTFINPGKTAKEYIEGNRVNHYKPILLTFVLSGLSTFLSYKVLNFKEMTNIYFSQQNLNSPAMADSMSFVSSYSSVIMLLLIPLFALVTKLAFRKWGHNYYEHVVLNAYVLSFYTLVLIVFLYPIMFFFRHSPDMFVKTAGFSILLIPAILLWFFKELYKDRPLKSIVLRVLGTLLLTALGYVILVLAATLIGVIFMVIKNKIG